jgi:hypothetical protein
MDIICYTGGMCGDIVNSVIDPSHSVLAGPRIYTNINRSKLKSNLFITTETEQLEYIKKMESIYLSIPSHKIDLHIKHKHPYITIFTENYDLALWCATRFKNLHPSDVWSKLGQSSVESYANTIIESCKHAASHTDKIITLEDILSGNLLSSLSKHVHTPLNEKLYEKWLSRQD